MKVVNQYIVTYKSALCNLMEVENGKFFVEFNEFNQYGWKKQIKEVTPEEAADMIIV